MRLFKVPKLLLTMTIILDYNVVSTLTPLSAIVESYLGRTAIFDILIASFSYRTQVSYLTLSRFAALLYQQRILNITIITKKYSKMLKKMFNTYLE